MDNFTKYINYGFGPMTNLVFSYIVGWGPEGTYASNGFISDLLGMSLSSVKRSLKELHTDNKIIITNPNGRSRHIRVNSQLAHIEPQLAQSEPQVAQGEPDNQVNMSHNKIDNKIDNNNSNKIDNNITIQVDNYTDEETLRYGLSNGYTFLDTEGNKLTKKDIEELISIF